MNAPKDKRAHGGGEESPRTDSRLSATETHVEILARLPAGTILSGRYRIEETVGVGGMGVVYRAHDQELALDVAVKVLRPDLASDPRVVERFRGEILSARQVTHRNVVRIHDIGEHEGLRFLTMTYVPGRSLKEILEHDGPLSIDRAIAIVRQVASALGEAHEKGIVHRDLKPGNILVDPEGNVFIADFGVARSLERDGLTRAGAIVGTPDYLAPEQISGDPVDGRTDLYALGIVLYEMLSGDLPFRGESQAEILAQRLAGRPRDLKETGVQTPSWLRQIIRRCLERSPARRYPDAPALIADLGRKRVSGTRRLTRALAIATLALAVGLGLWVLSRWRSAGTAAPPSTAGAAPRHAVAVLPLVDETADASFAWTSTGIAEMLSSNLSESPNLRVLDSLRVLSGVKDLRIDPSRLDEHARSVLHELWGVDLLVTGVVRRAGQRLRVDMTLQETGSTDAAAARHLSREAVSPEQLFRLVGDLGADLRHELGLEPHPRARPPGPQTSSLEAARAFEEGRRFLAIGDDLKAVPAFERAVAADPHFAAALESLAETYEGLGFHEKAVATAARALKEAGSDPTGLSYRIRARVALLSGNPAEAERVYRQLLERNPNLANARLDLANAQAAQGHNAQAVETLKKSVETDSNDPRAWLALGKNAILAGESRKAIDDYLLRALALQSQLHSEKGKADVLGAIATAYQRLNDYPKALENYTSASRIEKEIGDERGLARVLQSRALIYQAIGKIREARADLEAARELFERIGDRVGSADTWNTSGVIEESRGAYGPALEAYQSALKLRRALGDERRLAQSYDNVGYIYYLQGEYDNALVFWQQALDLRRKIGEKSGVLLSVQNMGFLQTAQGHWDEAVRSFLEALEKSREIDQKDAIAISLGNLGILQELRGRFSAALSSLEEALAVARSLQFQAALTEFSLKKAEILQELGQNPKAVALLSQAEEWIRETGNHEQEADLEVLRGKASLERGDRAAARRAFERAVKLAAESGSRVSLLRARLARASGDASSGPAALEATLREAESLGHLGLILESSEQLARRLLARRRPGDAETQAARAIQLAERVGWSEGLYRLYALRGQALESSGDGAAAGQEYSKSAREIAKLQENIPAEMRASFDSLPLVQEIAKRKK